MSEDRYEKIAEENRKILTLSRISYHRSEAKRAFMLAALILAADGASITGLVTRSENPDVRQQAERVAIERMIEGAANAQKTEAAKAIHRGYSENSLGGEFTIAGKITADELKQMTVDLDAAKVQQGRFEKGVSFFFGLCGVACLAGGFHERNRARRLEKTLSNG